MQKYNSLNTENGFQNFENSTEASKINKHENAASIKEKH